MGCQVQAATRTQILSKILLRLVWRKKNERQFALDSLETWIIPGQILMGKPLPGASCSCKPAGAEVLNSAVAHNTPPPFQAAQNATTVNTRSSVALCTAERHTPALPECHPGCLTDSHVQQ